MASAVGMVTGGGQQQQRPAPLNPPSGAHASGVDAAWGTLIGVVDSYTGSHDGASHSQSQLSPRLDVASLADHISTLRSEKGGCGLIDVLRSYVLSVLDRAVRDTVAPHFWSLLDPSADTCADEGLQMAEPPGNVEIDHDNESVASSSPLSPQRRAYGRVKRALLYVSDQVNKHLALVRLLDSAVISSAREAAGVGVSPGAESATAAEGSHSVEARYRCAFTAQVMARATSDFDGTMRTFFDRNLRFWHRSWLYDNKRERRTRKKRSKGVGSAALGDDQMDVSDEDAEVATGGGGGGDMDTLVGRRHDSLL